MFRTLFLIGTAACAHFAYKNTTQFEKTITVAEKKQMPYSGANVCTIKDSDGNTYKCVNNVWNFKFNKSETFNFMELNKSYTIMGYGVPNENFFMMPAIFDVKENS